MVKVNFELINQKFNLNESNKTGETQKVIARLISLNSLLNIILAT